MSSGPTSEADRSRTSAAGIETSTRESLTAYRFDLTGRHHGRSIATASERLERILLGRSSDAGSSIGFRLRAQRKHR